MWWHSKSISERPRCGGWRGQSWSAKEKAPFLLIFTQKWPCYKLMACRIVNIALFRVRFTLIWECFFIFVEKLPKYANFVEFCLHYVCTVLPIKCKLCNTQLGKLQICFKVNRLFLLCGASVLLIDKNWNYTNAVARMRKFLTNRFHIMLPWVSVFSINKHGSSSVQSQIPLSDLLRYSLDVSP